MSLDFIFEHKREETATTISYSFNMVGNSYLTHHHKIFGYPVLPGVVYLDFIMRCCQLEFEEEQPYQINQILFHLPLIHKHNTDDVLYEINIELQKTQDASRAVRVQSRCCPKHGEPSEFQEHLRCNLVILPTHNPVFKLDIPAFIEKRKGNIALEDAYNCFRELGLVYDKFLQAQGQIHYTNTEELMEINLNDLQLTSREKFYIHPALIDSSTFTGFSFFKTDIENMLYIPIHIKEVNVYKRLPAKIYVYNKDILGNDYRATREAGNKSFYILDDEGNILLEIKKMTLKKIRKESLLALLSR